MWNPRKSYQQDKSRLHSFKKTGAMITGDAFCRVRSCFRRRRRKKAAVKKIRGGNRAGVSDCRRCIDVTADAELGKTVGKDALQGKMTYASLFGVGGSMEIATEYTKEAEKALELFGDKAQPLLRWQRCC